MPVRLKTLHEIEEEITESVLRELGEAENVKGESGSEGEDTLISKQVQLCKRIKRFLTRFLKGFGSGMGVYAGIKIFTALMRNPFRERFVGLV